MKPALAIKVLAFVLIPVALVMALLLIIGVGQRQLMYFPVGDVPSIASLGLRDVEAVSFDTADGLRLSGWFFRLSEISAQHTSEAPTVIVFHGNAGNRAHRVPLAIALRRIGVQVLLFDYRGYGGNPGSPTEQGSRWTLALLVSSSADYCR